MTKERGGVLSGVDTREGENTAFVARKKRGDCDGDDDGNKKRQTQRRAMRLED